MKSHGVILFRKITPFTNGGSWHWKLSGTLPRMEEDMNTLDTVTTLNLESLDDSVTFCEALRKKYCPAMFEYDLNNMQISPKKREVIMQQRNHEKRVCLTLDGCQIDNAGEDGEIEKTCPLVQELDLSDNVLQDMLQVCLIADQLKYLSFINLSLNPLENVTLLDSCFTTATTYPSVEKLILNHTGLQFIILCKLLELFPRVQELHASINQYGSVPETHQHFTALQTLHFSKNEILLWEDIEHLGNIFPSLKTLIVCENPIEEIPADTEPEKYFPLLEKLSLAKTLVSNWISLDQLRRFPLLTDIRISRIPLLETYNDDKLLRQMLIARLPKMKVLNGGLIQEYEIEDAERSFIRYYKHENEKPQRYNELLSVHGELEDVVDVCFDRPHPYILVPLKGDIENPGPIEVDLGQKTIDFRKYLAKCNKLTLSQFRLILHVITGVEIMRVNSKYLYRYNITEGDWIELQRLDLDLT